ncbi:MAG: DUF5615 family PIN-like protein [Armatimonadetes bacterium]|nr:DUF5615 family PIN-like protein [Armatimonadota bacterium]
MTIWIDAQLSPLIAAWMTETLGVNAVAVRDLGLRDAEDFEIFTAAKTAGDVVVMTKDSDFVNLLQQHDAPPQVLWLTCGNTSNVRLKQILAETFGEARAKLQSGEVLVEISAAPPTKKPSPTSDDESSA